mmetsp:Transcript_86137/g.248718  ORF Transcript_86137/g.248718 Transcript_86137/m.248718 type:complete len:647 (-) Transcript_86137:331-2271(-)
MASGVVSRFDALVLELQEEHRREIADYQAELRRLRTAQAAETPQGTASQPPSPNESESVEPRVEEQVAGHDSGYNAHDGGREHAKVVTLDDPAPCEPAAVVSSKTGHVVTLDDPPTCETTASGLTRLEQVVTNDVLFTCEASAIVPATVEQAVASADRPTCKTTAIAPPPACSAIENASGAVKTSDMMNSSGTATMSNRTKSTMSVTGKASSKRKRLLNKYASETLEARQGQPDSPRAKFIKESTIKMKAFLKGPLEWFIGIIVILNVVLTYVRLEIEGNASRVIIAGNGEVVPEVPRFLDDLAVAFAITFMIELVVKLLVMKTEFFYGDKGWEYFHMFDAFIVIVSVVDIWVIPAAATDASGSNTNLNVVRMLRFGRVFRTLRLVRTFEVFAKLRVLIATVIASFSALIWYMVLLGLVMMIATLMLSQSLQPFFREENGADEFKAWAFRYYGTPTRTMWTVFEFTFSGGWPNYARPLVEQLGAQYGFFFLVYISGVTFAMFRIITALFLRDTLAVASADTELVIQEKAKDRNGYAQRLLDFFEAADTSGDGYLTIEEFESILNDERVKFYLTSLELDPAESRQLFELLDDGDQLVSVDEFVRGALRLKGQARSQDIVAIMHDCHKIMNRLVEVDAKVSKLTGSEG